LSQLRLRLLPAGLLLASGMVLPWVTDLTATSRVLLLIASTCLSLLAARQSGYGRPGRRLTALSWQQNHMWRLQFAAGEPAYARLLPSSWLNPWLLCLRLCDESGRTYQVMLWRNELSAPAWQQWQRRLRLEAGQATALPAS